MNFSRHIKLIESICESHSCVEIASKIAAGDHEGFNPYWKLVADSRILSDHDALGHIATLVSDGYTSGAHPTWELKMVDSKKEDLGPDSYKTSHSPFDEDNIDVYHDLPIDEDIIDVFHDHMVVPVAETHGPGQGWFEVSDEHATEFVVEDKNGDVVSSWSTREEAEEEAEHLNHSIGGTPHGDIMAGTHITPEMELVEDDEEPMASDTAPEPKSNRFDKSKSYIVIINAIHERGERQREALEELRARGLWLSKDQYRQADLPTGE